MAVPNVEPRFETLRERPEISPCIASGKLDWTTFTEGVSIAPRPRPTRRRPGTNATTLEEECTKPGRGATPPGGTRNPATIRVRCAKRFASRWAANDDART